MSAKLYPTHIPTTGLQKAILASGSALTAILSPWRGGKKLSLRCRSVYGRNYCWMGTSKNLPTHDGRFRRPAHFIVVFIISLLREKPRIQDDTISLEQLRNMPDSTLGREYARRKQRQAQGQMCSLSTTWNWHM
ncbi:ubiquinone biosynthesis protein coq-4 [Trichinella spiralis]|uniref:ubiquinone biosynthesis protein coq-4 n=1 Tax=Trichinella spiralis TaxID=6334 RepID=UPI0001EFBBBC|nr:ubiquinone biosynthesis protein coq-4 [Trichinella spiralis]